MPQAKLMGKKGKAILILLLTSCLLITAADKESDIIKKLHPKYQDWLKLVHYIILPQEKEVFLKLTNDRERDLFIEAFWRMRDPTPGTPENEYKEEIIKRFNYVNQTFRRGSTREGWQTDMGRIYMILGPPASTERFEGVLGLVPCQVWTYHGDTSKGLPPVFNLVFFQRHGSIEYKLYDPMVDGPASLLQDKRELGGLTNEEIFEKVQEIAPTLAYSTISLIPGEFQFDYSASPRYNLILADILNSPKKDVNPTYATHFLNYKGIVSTEYLTNYVDSEGLVEVIPDPATGLYFVHFSLAPKSLSLDFYEPRNQYYVPFQMDVSLRQKDSVVFQYNRNMSAYFSEDALPRIQGNGLAIEDSFPVAEGKFQVTVLLRNPVSKEFSILERQIEVPEPGSRPALSNPVIGYRTEKFPANQHFPFKVGETKILVDPKNTISASDFLAVSVNVINLTETLRQQGKIRLEIRALNARSQAARTGEINLNEKEFSRINNYLREISIRDLTPDYYELQLTLLDGTGNVLDQKKSNFILSPERIIGHPIVQAKGFNLNNLFYYYFVLASQYDKLSQLDKAGFYYEQAFRLNPGFRDGIKDYCQFLIKTSRFDRALEIAEGLKADDSQALDYHLFRGLALLGKQNYTEALDELLKAVSIYDSDTRVLNALGRAYIHTGQKEKARQALQASLRLNPEQPEIRKLLSDIDRK
ncbi:MAG: GWxTD domain-containing protein [Candidatus Saccharicenans sp.]|nr:GWxTD domain-containing protein [Candidatus Saccharicenans sp.]